MPSSVSAKRSCPQTDARKHLDRLLESHDKSTLGILEVHNDSPLVALRNAYALQDGLHVARLSNRLEVPRRIGEKGKADALRGSPSGRRQPVEKIRRVRDR